MEEKEEAPISRKIEAPTVQIYEENHCTLDEVFEVGKHNLVDKVLCGNSFTTAFLNSDFHSEKVIVMLAPNRSVVLDKEKQIGTYKNGKLYSYHYKGSSSVNMNADVYVMVIDSFLEVIKDFERNKHKIARILVDECHTVDIQSSFRRKLIGFNNVLEPFLEHSAIVSVSATPNLFDKVTHRIVNNNSKPITINVTHSYLDSIRIKKLIANGEKVVVFTNNKNIIYHLKDKNKTIKCELIIGETLKRSVYEIVNIQPGDNLKIISSTGFEGIDIIGEGWNVFFFEHRSNKEQTFCQANRYQAFNRTRSGAKYCELCFIKRGTPRRKIKSISQLERFVNRTDISIEQKQKKKYKDYPPYLIFKYSDSIGSVSVNHTAINLHDETLISDNEVFTDKFKKDRNITVVNLNEKQVSIPRTRIKDDYKIAILKGQKYLPKGLYGEDYTLPIYAYKNSFGRISMDRYIKELETYLRRKNHDGSYVNTHQEDVTLELFKSDPNTDLLGRLASGVEKANRMHNNKNLSRRKARINSDEFKKIAKEITLSICQSFTNEKIRTPSRFVVHRDYNNFTLLSNDAIKEIAERYGVKFDVIEISNSSLRIVYAICGIELPTEFKNPNDAGAFLNYFFYDESKDSSKAMQKYNTRIKFRKLGFDERVIEYLMNNFFDGKFKGNLFNLLAFHEKKLINKLKFEFKDDENIGMVRKHNSLLVFNKTDKNVNLPDDIEYLNQRNWFKITINDY